VVAASTYNACFRRLRTGAATLAVSSDETLLQKLHAAGIPAADVRRVPEPLVQSAGYIAFSPQVGDEVIRRWQAALNGLIASGRLQILYDRYYER
jgi:ABC-type amino acid transport substrate-binding protein